MWGCLNIILAIYTIEFIQAMQVYGPVIRRRIKANDLKLIIKSKLFYLFIYFIFLLSDFEFHSTNYGIRQPFSTKAKLFLFDKI